MITKHRIAKETMWGLISGQLSASKEGHQMDGSQGSTRRRHWKLSVDGRVTPLTWIPTEKQKYQEEGEEQVLFICTYYMPYTV